MVGADLDTFGREFFLLFPWDGNFHFPYSFSIIPRIHPIFGLSRGLHGGYLPSFSCFNPQVPESLYSFSSNWVTTPLKEIQLRIFLNSIIPYLGARVVSKISIQ